MNSYWIFNELLLMQFNFISLFSLGNLQMSERNAMKVYSFNLLKSLGIIYIY